MHGKPFSLRVMVVDDNHDTADVLAAILKLSGHDVRSLYDGPSAIKTALEFLPHVILMDVGLPQLDGYEVAKKIRELPTIKDVVMVAVTGYAGTVDRVKSYQAGFNNHLAKPASVEDVQRILATVAAAANNQP